MTTNSPNPVDGDVRALIADCQAEIAELEKRLTTWGEEWIPYLQSKLKRQQVAHAALTTKPVGTVSIAMDWNTHRNIATVNMRPDLVLAEMKDGDEIYTTPPAKLLRPVEFAESQRLCNGYYFDMNDVFEALEEAGIPFKVKS